MQTFIWALAAIMFLAALSLRHVQWRYTCSHCGTSTGDHGEQCPWRDR